MSTIIKLQKSKTKHIVTYKPFERIHLDLVDLRIYNENNDGFGWIWADLGGV